ncbi:hypothetical protein [Candidatus Pelagibacter sp. HIMB1782]|uniref:hypothetical protein n=1 Tax=Candidatus Pelagibacter sp. HIMB1782 TaxID=3413375 RepID=UPI003F84BB21
MKKLLSIIVFSLLFGGSGYSEETILNCEFDQGQIIWREGKIEAYNNTDPAKPRNKTLRINSKKKELFLFIDDISPLEKNQVMWTDKEIKWFFNDDDYSVNTDLNRYSGSLVESMIFKNNSELISRTHSFNCKKEEKKF